MIKLRHTFLALVALALASCSSPCFDPSSVPDADASQISRIEPPCWWTDMNQPLQLLVHGEGIGEYNVDIEGLKGVSVVNVHKAESVNYLFVDVKIGECAQEGTAYLVFSRDGQSFKVPYEICKRREGSAERGSFTTADAIYLLMPDRFANGDNTNDATDDTVEGPDYQAFFGRHGGDVKGIADHLDYMADLGMTALWCTPLLEDNQPGGSYHGYACTDYYRIDSRFGSNEQYRDLVATAHSKGIKMIMDMVPNHCGDRHWWMKDLPFDDWVHVWPEYTHSNCCFSMQNDPYASQADRDNMVGGWFDISMVDMNLDNPFLLEYFKMWAIWWIEWADLDGLRVDTFPYNEKYPIAQWCKAITDEYPAMNIVGEVWSVNVPQVAYWQKGNPNRDGYDSCLPSIMDFPLQSAICRGFNEDKTSWDEGMVRIYDAIANDLYYENIDNMMIFPGNHDTDRIADVLGGDNERLKMVMTLMATLRGYPQIFSGDELGQRSRDIRQGHGGLRVEFPDNWAENPAMKDVHDHTRALLQWRRTSDAVQHGNTLHFLRRDNTYAYFRYTDDDVVFVFLNNNAAECKVPWNDYCEFAYALERQGVDIVSGDTVDMTNVTVPGRSSLVVNMKYNNK